MIKIAVPLITLAALTTALPALAASSDDAKWVAQCIQDNASSKAPVETITKYCTCMNDKMDENETKSISQWEKSHPKEMAECDKVAGWK